MHAARRAPSAATQPKTKCRMLKELLDHSALINPCLATLNGLAKKSFFKKFFPDQRAWQT